MTHVEPESSSAFELLVGVLRLIFDLVMLAVVMLVIGFFIFTGSIERSQLEPRTADGIAVLTGGAARIDEAMKL